MLFRSPNRLPAGRTRSPFTRFFAQFNNILVYVLLAAGFTKLMLSQWIDAGIIFAVVVLNALLGFIQEGKAEKALDSIRNMLSTEARTMRSGETRMIPAEQLVPGDVVLLESGDKIPADLRLIEAKNLRTEEAALTGESVPAEKTVDAVPGNATVGDRGSMAFSGTMVVSGRATGVVVATGRETELGRINQLLAEVSALDTPLLRQIKKFDVPTLVMHGEDDQVVPIKDSAKKSAKLIKGAQEIYYPGKPHGLTATDQDEVNTDLLKFLKSVQQARKAAA